VAFNKDKCECMQENRGNTASSTFLFKKVAIDVETPDQSMIDACFAARGWYEVQVQTS